MSCTTDHQGAETRPPDRGIEARIVDPKTPGALGTLDDCAEHPARNDDKEQDMTNDDRALALIGEGGGLLLTWETTGGGESHATVGGVGTLLGVPVVSSGTLSFQGSRRRFRGFFDFVLCDGNGARVARWRGSHVGRHTDLQGSAALRAVGSFDLGAAASPAGPRDVLLQGFNLAEVEVHQMQSFGYRIHRLGFRSLGNVGPLVPVGAAEPELRAQAASRVHNPKELSS